MITPRHYVPFESDTDVFTALADDLGSSRFLEFVEIWSISGPEQRRLVPAPCPGFDHGLFRFNRG